MRPLRFTMWRKGRRSARAAVLAGCLFFAVGADAQPSSVSMEDFLVADPARKARMLIDVAAVQAQVAIVEVIPLVRAGLHDPDVGVRSAALAAVSGRAMAARWAGTAGPLMGPTPSGQPAPPRPAIPSHWGGDQQALRAALDGDCRALLTGDPDDRVRHQALLAVFSLGMPAATDGLLSQPTIALLVDRYRHDSSARIRAEVVKTLRLVPSDTPDVGRVLVDALVDPDPSIRAEGLLAIVPRAAGTPARPAGPVRRPPELSFDEAREVVVASLAHVDAGVRLGAVQALNAFGAPAALYIDTLERLADLDPDPQVRASARLAIEAIKRAVR
jgi:HEAT repeat protein